MVLTLLFCIWGFFYLCRNMKRIWIINGPNLNLLGKREEHIYGAVSFEQYFKYLQEHFSEIELCYFQSNVEGELVTKLQECAENCEGVVLNAAAYTHTSVAIADAVAGIKTPVVEVHISNVAAREAFRHSSFLTPVCRGLIMGFGLQSYKLAIASLLDT